MNILGKIKILCNENNISLTKLEKDLNLSTGMLCKWANHSPSVENLKKVSDYFNVSIDYFLDEGKEKNNQLQIFNNEQFGKIRMIEIEDKPYFVATDIAKALGYVNPSDAVKKHCRWVAKCEVPHPQSKNKTLEVNVIPEGDMYRLITNSELPSAEKFESWVFDEVLPSIRRTGFYGNNKNLLLQFLSTLPQDQIKQIIYQLQHNLLPSKPIKEALYDFLSDNRECLSLTCEDFVEVNYKIFLTYFENNGYRIDDVMKELRYRDLIQADAFGFCVKNSKIIIKMKPSLKFYECEQ